MKPMPGTRDPLDAATGALLGTFVGDALGMPFEGTGPEAIPVGLEMEEARLGRGTYTDDTQMMIALAESLIDRGEIDEPHLARAFLEAFDPDRGYGSGTVELFALWARGAPVTEAASRLFGGQGSRGNGAAMRIAPVAVRFPASPVALREQAMRSARLTHAHPLAVDAAVVQAAAIAAALRGDDILPASRDAATMPVMGEQLARATELPDDTDPTDAAAQLGNSAEGHRSVPAAIYAAASRTRFEDAVGFAVRCGGDTDTLGAMTGAIAGARQGASAIPRRWLDALEDGPRGRSHVEKLAHRLARGG
jgi:poly(ADP-ribose) glycohydrolase ARH3